MRFLIATLATFALASCATSEDRRFRVGESENALVIIGVAEAAANTSARYSLLWRLLDADGAFTELDGDTAFEAETNNGDTVRVRGIPGEFFAFEIEPGVYALDSVFAVIRDDRINYIAQGLVTDPERPSVQLRAGEAAYLGIWQADLDEDSRAVARPWRLQQSDLRAVLGRREIVVGDVRMRETQERAVACTPRRMSHLSQRQIC
jgi:hypothetical protein